MREMCPLKKKMMPQTNFSETYIYSSKINGYMDIRLISNANILSISCTSIPATLTAATIKVLAVDQLYNMQELNKPRVHIDKS